MNRGVAIVHYDRLEYLREITESVLGTVPNKCKVVVVDDGTDGDLFGSLKGLKVITIQGPNKGVGYNKNRALWALQDCSYICLLEDDLKPIERGWFHDYENAAKQTSTHHFCRIQDKVVPESHPTFTEHLNRGGLTPIFGTSPRGDLTFLTGSVINSVGGFNHKFKGVGYAHGEWSERVWKAGLIPHPLKWYDIKEARDKFIQIGDTEGGRWKKSRQVIRKEIRKNDKVRKELEDINYIYHPLVFE